MREMAQAGKLLALRGISAICIGIALGLIGPFNTFAILTLGQSIPYWILLCLIAWAQIETILFLVSNWGTAAHFPLAGRTAITGLLAAIPLAFEIQVLETALGIPIFSLSHTFSPATLFVIYLRAAVMNIVLGVPATLLWEMFTGLDLWHLPTVATTPTPRRADKAIWPWQGFSAVLIGAGLAIIGPYDTYGQLRLQSRLIFWVGMSVLAWIQIEGALRLFTIWPMTMRLHLGLRAALAGAFASIPITVELQGLNHYFRGAAAWAFDDFLVLYPAVAILAVMIAVPATLFWHGLYNVQTAPAAKPTAEPSRPAQLSSSQKEEAASFRPPAAALPRSLVTPGASSAEVAAPRFLQKLPHRLREPILALRQEDHYLRIYFERGSELLLYRLSDAVSELSDRAGLRVHRSWWAARDAIVGFERRGKAASLQLRNGLTVPVSRTYLRDLQQAGWQIPDDVVDQEDIRAEKPHVV